MITGHKWFTSGANRAAYTTVFAKTDPGEDNKYTAVLGDHRAHRHARLRDRAGGADDGPHLRRALRGAATTRCGCRAANLLGERGHGFVIAQKRLGPGRIFHCMRWLGQAQRAFELMCERANTRFAHGSLLAQKGEIQRYVAESAAEIQAARLMTLDAARAHGQRVARRGSRSASSSSAGRGCSTTWSTAPSRCTARSGSPATRRSRRCTARRGTPGSTTAPTRSTAWSWPRNLLKDPVERPVGA